MRRVFNAALTLVLAIGAAAAKDKPDTWIEARSPHFVVATNGNEKQARRALGQFERIRAVFQRVFPNQRIDPVSPIIVLATKNEKSFKELEPREWQAKGALKRSGLFQRGAEKNYVLMRLDSAGDNPYEIVYHEYTHLITSQSGVQLPLWLDEGFAEFYGNSEVQDKQVLLGKVSEGELEVLRQTKLLPLETLFAVDHTSPYYNENNKGSIFYAESWALVHMLTNEGFGKEQNPLRDYLNLISKKTDPLAAAHQAFGDFGVLLKHLQAYVDGSQFRYFYAKGATDVDDQSFTVRDLSPAESDALRGDFLVYTQNYETARDVLRQALEEDPKSSSAFESMGLMALYQKNLPEAAKWFTQAAQLDSKSYLAYYYSATVRMRESNPRELGDDVGENLRKSIALNPRFAPAIDSLAQFYGIRGENLEEAHKLALQAVELEPGNMYHYLTMVNILLRLRQADDAVRVANKALGLAKTPLEMSQAQETLASAESYQKYLEEAKRFNEHNGGDGASLVQTTSSGPASDGDDPAHPVLRRRSASSEQSSNSGQDQPGQVQFHSDPSARGQRNTMIGKIEDVQCSSPSVMKVTLVSGKSKVTLYTENYFQLEFTALNFTPSGELHPCEDIKEMRAKITFYDLKGRPNEGELTAVELRK